VIGCAVAWAIAKEARRSHSWSAILLAHASSVTAGMLAPDRSEAAQRRDGPGEAAFLDLALRSSACSIFAEVLRESTDIDVECVKSGISRVAQSAESAVRLRERYEWLRALERGVVWLDRSTLREAVPALGEAHGAFFSPQEGHVHSGLLVRALAQAAAQNGATVLEGTRAVEFAHEDDRITGVRTDRETVDCGRVVLATGPWETWPKRWVSSPVVPEKGQLLTVRPSEALLGHVVFADTCYLVPRLDGSLVVGATSEEAGFDARPTA
jgi:glycine oxidase